jgi:hypothetical protein
MLADSAVRLRGQAKSAIYETCSYKRKHKVIFLFNSQPINDSFAAYHRISWCTVCQYLLSPVDVLSAVRVDLCWMRLFIGFCFLGDVYFKPSLVSIQSATQPRRFAKKKKKKICWWKELKVIVEIKLKGKVWGNPLEDKNVYKLRKKGLDKIRKPVTLFVKSRRLYQAYAVNNVTAAEDRLRRGSNSFGSARSVTSPSQRWLLLSKRISHLFSRFPWVQTVRSRRQWCRC